jgi:hypothetical protein
MQALLAAGLIALAFVVGNIMIDGVRVREVVRAGVSRIALAVGVGIVLLAPMLVLLARLSVFRPAAIGLVGWIALTTWIARHRRARFHFRDASSAYVVIVAAIAFGVVAANGRDEPFGAGRDQQVYATFAMALTRAHADTVVITPSDAADAALLRAVGDDRAIDRYLGIRRSIDANGALALRSYLPLGFTVWLAIAAAIGGIGAVALANVAFVGAGALLFERAVRPLVGPAISAGGAVALLALPSSLWIAGVTLSEPLAMLAWLALLSLVAQWRRLPPLPIAVLLFAFATIRIDALALAPLVDVAILVHAIASGNEEARRRAQSLALAMLALVVGAVGWHAALDRAYLLENAWEVLAVALAAAALAIVARAPQVAYAHARRLLASRWTIAIVAAAIVAALLYAALVRPTLAPFALIHAGTGLDGSRDFREDSLRNLASYTGWPIVALAGLGALMLWRRAAGGRASTLACLLFITGAGMAALYLGAPLVSPDHPWAVRRFVPVVLPSVIALATMALAAMADRFPALPRVANAAVPAALALGAAVAHGSTVFATRANEGMVQTLRGIEAKLPDALVVCDAAIANVCGPLTLAFGHPIVVANLADAGVHAAVGRWFVAKAALGHQAWVLHRPSLSLAGTQAECTGQWRFVRHFVAPTTRPPAHDVASEAIDVDLARVDALDARFVEKRFGETPVFGVVDHGFYPAEPTPFGTVRMTNGSAMLEMPAVALAPFRTLQFDWFSWAPRGERRTTRVTIDGREVWSQSLAPGVSSSAVSLPPLGQGLVRIGIQSETFDPRFLDASDPRTHVGIGLLGIRPQR